MVNGGAWYFFKINTNPLSRFNFIIPSTENYQILESIDILDLPYLIPKNAQNLQAFQLVQILHFLDHVEGQVQLLQVLHVVEIFDFVDFIEG